MAFVDELTLHVKAGRGGDGVVRWRHEKGKEFMGPSGGNGGRGGDVYVRAVRDIGILARYRHLREFEAENGQFGMRDSKYGKNGEELVIDLPVGSVVTDLSNEKKFQLLTEGEKVLVAKGGRGGLGNEHFKASTNVSPKESTPGKEGEEKDLYVELELIVDAGLVGLPNAGKSSLLNELTNAQAKVGGFMFTTLEPNLGDMYGFILADIPGLIEGAAEGKGLGHKFLRHIKRTKMLLHCISLESEDVEAIYQTVRKEIELYGEGLSEKPEAIILTKTDLSDEERLVTAVEKMRTHGKHVFSVTVYDDASVKRLKEGLVKLLRAE